MGSCRPDVITPCADCGDDKPIVAEYQPQPYELTIPSWFSQPNIPADNPLTLDGVELGRFLFYDPILSADSTMSCGSCHLQEKGFADGLAVSTGIRGLAGTRSSMALVNLGYNSRGFFWDGRSATLEQQALLPIEDHLEMDDDWDNVLKKLRRHEVYPKMFRKAFGIERTGDITKELAAKAMAQFERTLISLGSRYDKVIWDNQGWFTDAEERGRQLFFFEEGPQALDHPGCSHCHLVKTFTDNNFYNNGLDDVPSLNDFVDKGRGAITGSLADNGKFRAPTLRNIALTAPYMHDGRFATLEEVIDQYSIGGHGVINENTNIRPFTLNAEQQADLIAFLHTLTDQDFVTNPAFKNPFE